MLIVRSFNCSNAFKVWQCCLDVPNPFAKAITPSSPQAFHNPWEIRTIRFEAPDMAWRACLPNEQTVQDELLHSFC